MNDIKPTTGLPMSSGGIDVGGTPYGANPISNNSSNFDNNTYESSGSNYTIIDRY